MGHRAIESVVSLASTWHCRLAASMSDHDPTNTAIIAWQPDTRWDEKSLVEPALTDLVRIVKSSQHQCDKLQYDVAYQMTRMQKTQPAQKA